MSEWISIEEAAEKYSIKKEYIQLWVDMQVIISYFKDGGMLVSDESLRGFLKIREQGISPDYLKILEQFCIGRSETCLTYVYLLGARDKEIEMYRDAKLQRDTIRGMWMEQNERIYDLELELELEQGNCYKCWLKKVVFGTQKTKIESAYKDNKNKENKNDKVMKIFKKTEFPTQVKGEEFTVDVITCDKDGLINIGFYNFDMEMWLFHTSPGYDYTNVDFVWIYPPIDEMKEVLVDINQAKK